MARLIIYIPFTRGEKGDLRTNAKDLVEAPLGGFTINDEQITEVVAVYLGEEDANQVAEGDFLCVHAHGGTGNYTAVTDNQGESATLDVLEKNLKALAAEKAKASYFFVCFSGEKNHVAARWKAAYPEQAVYGSNQVAQGGIIRKTRRMIYSSIFDKNNGQLQEL